MSPRPALLVLLSLALLAPAAATTPLLETQQLDPWTSGDGAPGDGFGNALATQGDWLAIGSFGTVLAVPGILNGLPQGVVHLYSRQPDGYQPTQLLRLPEAVVNANFGRTLAIRGERLAVAAPRHAVEGVDEAGRVFIYRAVLGEWQLEAQLDPPQPAANGRFGSALAWLGDDDLLVGAPREPDRGATEAGRVHRFQWQGGNWSASGILLPQNAEAGAGYGSALLPWQGGVLVGAPGAAGAGAVDQHADPASPPLQRLPSPFDAGGEFGAALAGDGLRLAIGAPAAANGAVPAAGRVALYLGGPAAVPDQLLGALEPESLARHGHSLLLTGAQLWIGVPQADVGGDADEGIVLVHPLDGSGAGPPIELSNAFPGLSGRLGVALARDDNGALLAGADLDQVGANGGQGSVSIFASNGSGFAAPLRLARGDGAYIERFGSALAIAGDWAVASSFLERTEAGAEAGAAYVYRREGASWQRFQRLLSADPATEQRFGVDVAISADRIAVGAYWDATLDVIDAGAVYLYRFDGSTWQPEATLRSPLPEEREFYGFRVALDGDRLLVSAPGADRSAFDEGAGYVYRLQDGSWQIEGILEVPGDGFLDGYGASAALSGDFAVLGSASVQVNGLGSAGSVAAFKASGGSWAHLRQITAAVPAQGAGFGGALALQGNLLAVGAATESAAGSAAGAVHIGTVDGLAPPQRLLAADARLGDRLGSSVALTAGVLLAGAPGVDIDDQPSQGALYRWRWRNGQWQPDPRLLTAAGSGLDGLGLSLAADGEWAILGAPFKAGFHPQEGRAHMIVVGSLYEDGFE